MGSPSIITMPIPQRLIRYAQRIGNRPLDTRGLLMPIDHQRHPRAAHPKPAGNLRKGNILHQKTCSYLLSHVVLNIAFKSVNRIKCLKIVNGI